MYSVYVLKSHGFDRIYIGMSSDVETRLKKHNKGHVISTKAYVPFKLVYSELVGERESARKREKQLKKHYCRELIKNLIINHVPVAQWIEQLPSKQ